MSSPQNLSHLASTVPCTPPVDDLVTLLRQAAAEVPESLYIDLLDAQNTPHDLSFGRVLEDAERWARWLMGQGLPRNAPVALLLPTGEDFLFAFFGTQIAGLIPVPLAFPLSLGSPDAYVATLGRIVADAQPALFITVERLESMVGALVGPACRVVIPAHIVETTSNAGFPAIQGSDVALIQYSSGRVSDPTGVVLTHKAVISNVFGLGTALRLSAADVALTWVPLVHDMGLIGGLLTSLYWRCPLHVMPPQTFLMHPYRWLANISRFRVTLAAAPNAGYQLCVRRIQDRHLAGLDLSCWRLALNGAETVHPATVEAFAARFAGVGFRRASMCPVYGLAENTLATSCPDPDDACRVREMDGVLVVSTGLPLPGQELAVLGEDGAILPQGQPGDVVVRGPCVMSGYRGNAAATALAIDPEGWLHTGDLGFIQDDRLFLTGRRKDMVIKMGRNYYPSDVEALVAAPSLAFARPNPAEGTDDMVLLVESDAMEPEQARTRVAEINGDLLARLGIRADTLAWVGPGALAGRQDPRQRSSIRDRFLAGLLA